jgi:sugar transferase (PEP-CTERM system associated)
MNFLNNSFTSKNILLITGDLLIAIASVYAGALLRLFYIYPAEFYKYSPLMPKAIIFSFFIVTIYFFMDLYDIERNDGKKEIFLKIISANFLAVLADGAFYYFVPYTQLGRGILFLSFCFTVLFSSLWHISYILFVKLPIIARRILILGTGPIAKIMGNLLLQGNNGLALAGYVNCVGEQIHVPRDYILGKGEELLEVAIKEKVQKIVVSLTERRGTFPVREVLNCKLQGIDIIDGLSFYEQITGKLLIESMNPSHLIFSDGFRITVVRRYFKRIFDMVFALMGIILSLPFLIVIPILIKLESKGPVLFRQKRVGEGEKYFTLYKFRTMIDEAEKNTGPVWSQAGDSRVTKIGKFLRKTRLDEIPQLFNVVLGEMSFVGPRPERPFFVESLKKQIPYYSERHCIKPGLTGWAQVRYEYGDSIEDAIEKLRYDLYYIKYQSLSLDLLIVLDTIKVILFGKGGR